MNVKAAPPVRVEQKTLKIALFIGLEKRLAKGAFFVRSNPRHCHPFGGPRQKLNLALCEKNRIFLPHSSLGIAP